jgi:hypothetical protein
MERKEGIKGKGRRKGGIKGRKEGRNQRKKGRKEGIRRKTEGRTQRKKGREESTNFLNLAAFGEVTDIS